MKRGHLSPAKWGHHRAALTPATPGEWLQEIARAYCDTADAIPVADCVRVLASELGDMDPLTVALNSGEEYELLFTSPAKNREAIASLSSELGLPITAIGQITHEREVVIANGTRTELAPGGWEHLI